MTIICCITISTIVYYLNLNYFLIKRSALNIVLLNISQQNIIYSCSVRILYGEVSIITSKKIYKVYPKFTYFIYNFSLCKDHHVYINIYLDIFIIWTRSVTMLSGKFENVIHVLEKKNKMNSKVIKNYKYVSFSEDCEYRAISYIYDVRIQSVAFRNFGWYYH